MTLLETQKEFSKMVALLIFYAYQRGYTITFGDAWAKEGHRVSSLHYKRCAIDLNLFCDGEYLTSATDHQVLGNFWESLHPRCRWGGHFAKKDGNHYEMVPDQG